MARSGSHNRFVKVMSMEERVLNTIKYHDGFMGQRIGPLSAVAFHPCVLAAEARLGGGVEGGRRAAHSR